MALLGAVTPISPIPRRRAPRLLVAALVVGLAAGCASAPSTPAAPPRPTGPCALPADAPGATAAAPGVPGAPEVATGYRSGLAEVRTRSYAVSTANPLATRAACEVLRGGGTAADAVVVAQGVLGLVEPQSSGVGGGGFLLYADAATGRVDAYDGRETAPAGADGEYLRRTSPTDPTPPRPDARASGRSIGVPGVVRMLETVQREYGRTPWRDLLAPAARLAADGFPISPRLASSIAESRDRLAADPASAAYFLRPDGSPRRAGELLRNPALASTMTALGDGGADALYTGRIAADVVGAARDATGGRTPSLLTAEDLAGYRPVKREAVCTPYGPYQVCGMPPPSSGGITVASTLGILDALRIDAEKPEPAGPDGAVPTAAGAHLVAEAERLAYADRDRYVADTDFVPLPSRGAGPSSPAALLDPAYLRARAATVNRERSVGTAQAGALGPVPRGTRPEGPEHGTSHVSVVDRYGNAASFTTSVESAFGSFHLVDGFLLNNQLTDFSAAPTDPAGVPMANRVQPGKRPRSSMAPTLVFALTPDGRRGELRYVTGSPGGSQIPQFVVKTLVQALDWGAGPQAAVSAIDLGAVNAPSTGVGGEHPDVAAGRAAALVDGLRQRGHQVSTAAQSSGLSMLARTPDGWAGGADPRREGVVLGDTP